MVQGFKTVTQASLAALLFAAGASAQAVISAKAGVIHYVEGEVFVGEKDSKTAVEVKTGGRYTDVKENQELSTGEGRVEVLLNPGVFLRLGENSSVKMISTRLVDTRLDVTKGSALIEVVEVLKDNTVTVLAKDAALTVTKSGLFRLDPETGIRVYKGEAQVMAGGNPEILKEGREMLFPSFEIAKFDAKAGDPLYRWASRRAQYIAMANIASANMVKRNGNGYVSNGWVYNQYYGMMTYLPYGTMYRSPFGYTFYSPGAVGRYFQRYNPPVASAGGFGGGPAMGDRTWNNDLGYYQTGGRVAAMPSGGSSVGAPAAAASGPAASAPAAGRGADSSVGRGGGGGRSGQ